MGEGDVIEVVEREPTKFYLPDTNVAILNALSPYMLANYWDGVREDEFGRALYESLIRQGEDLDAKQSKPTNVIISSIVERELDGLAHGERKDGAKWLARRATAVLEQIRKTGLHYLNDRVSEAILPNGAHVYFVRHDENEFNRENHYDPNNDDRIIHCLAEFARENLHSNTRFQFVSQDRSARNRCRDAFVRMLNGHPQADKLLETCTDEFWQENVRDPYHRYTGRLPVQMTKQQFDQFRQVQVDITEEGDRPDPLKKYKFKHNQFLELIIGENTEYRIIKRQDGRVYARHLTAQRQLKEFIDEYNKRSFSGNPITASSVHVPSDIKNITSVYDIIKSHKLVDELTDQLKAICRDHKEEPELAYKKVMWEILKGSNGAPDDQPFPLKFNTRIKPVLEQVCAEEIGADASIGLGAVEGPWGSGKTLFLCRTAAALVAKGIFNGIYYMRPIVGVDEGLGFLPGDFNEKINPWIAGFRDALHETFGVNDAKPLIANQLKDTLQSMEDLGVIEWHVATAQAGRTWRNKYVIIDEAHLFTADQLRMLIGRAGRGSVVRLIGDPKQVDSAHAPHRILTEHNNGFSRAVERLSEGDGDPNFAHVTFTSPGLVLRSPTANLARKI